MRLFSIVREMNYATARALELKLMRDAGIPDRVPDTYAEFLLLTSATWRHEPPASARFRAGPESCPGRGLLSFR